VSAKAKSLIEADAAQLALLSTSDMEAGIFSKLEAKGEYTGERLFRNKPEVYNAIVRMLAENIGMDRIGHYLGVTQRTVMGVRDREGAAITVEKERLSKRCYGVAAMAFDSVAADLSDPKRAKKISTKDKAIVGGIAVQNAQLLAGEATSRMEVVEQRDPDHDAFNELVAGVGIGIGMGSVVGNLNQKGAGASAAPAADSAAPAAAPGAGRDGGAGSATVDVAAEVVTTDATSTVARKESQQKQGD
jgi:hypothetical protein